MSTDRRTYCGEPRDEPAPPDALAWACGRPATGPHPDPAISYRRPLCDDHRERIMADLGLLPIPPNVVLGTN